MNQQAKDKNQASAISPRRSEDFPEWYQQVIKNAELAENSPVRGCMVIKPWGWGIWERLQEELDQRIKDTGHENAYFPLFIPLSFLEKEAQHVEGFAKECAIVTHHRLEQRDGKLVPAGELEEPLIVRPTSETIIGESFSRWIKSYRDLPLLINQWANVVRWEMRTRIFLRTTEFLWQEGHTAHATAQEAMLETEKMLGVYSEFLTNVLAIPCISGEKPVHERFPGAERTFCVEAMMQDRKALQAGTSHYLGQNFARSSNIRFVDESGIDQIAFTTSWGVSTRLIGGLIMTHSDDDGLRVPPKAAPKHVVILPVIPKPETEQVVNEYCDRLAQELRALRYDERKLVVHIDRRDKRGGDKSWDWIKRGIPLRLEVGPRDVEGDSAAVYRRDLGAREKSFMKREELLASVPAILADIQKNYLQQALQHRDQNICDSLTSYEEFEQYFTPKNREKPEIHAGFVRAKWSEDPSTVEKLAQLKVSVRCLPLDQSGTEGRCILTGKPAIKDAIFAKAY